eukprot:m.8097 g.8097  ORF g.8097 m.8097 type:complete len:85 (+) comp9035_c0_seq2:857-1111(+)
MLQISEETRQAEMVAAEARRRADQAAADLAARKVRATALLSLVLSQLVWSLARAGGIGPDAAQRSGANIDCARSKPQLFNYRWR